MSQHFGTHKFVTQDTSQTYKVTFSLNKNTGLYDLIGEGFTPNVSVQHKEDSMMVTCHDEDCDWSIQFLKTANVITCCKYEKRCYGILLPTSINSSFQDEQYIFEFKDRDLFSQQ
jgi:hypothetical protein